MGELKWTIANAKGQGTRSSSSSPTSIAAILSNVSIEDDKSESERPPSGCFSNIPPTSDLLLLTPYLHMPPPISPTGVQMDPFEPFGKKLCQLHNRIKHVPYIAKHGMIQIHQEMIQKSGGVLVVICDSSASEQYQGEERLDHVHDQQNFVKEVDQMVASLSKPSMLLLVALKESGPTFSGSRIEVRTWNDLGDSIEVMFDRN